MQLIVVSLASFRKLDIHMHSMLLMNVKRASSFKKLGQMLQLNSNEALMNTIANAISEHVCFMITFLTVTLEGIVPIFLPFGKGLRCDFWSRFTCRFLTSLLNIGMGIDWFTYSQFKLEKKFGTWFLYLKVANFCSPLGGFHLHVLRYHILGLVSLGITGVQTWIAGLAAPITTVSFCLQNFELVCWSFLSILWMQHAWPHTQLSSVIIFIRWPQYF